MEIIKIKEQSINAEESKLYKKMLDSLGVRTVTETFENGTLARKRFNELKKKP